VSSSNVCLEVVGHSSRTGAESYNDALSLQRAQAVQSALVRNQGGLAGKVFADGRGFRNNIIGTGSDDAQDAIDRRVEFNIVGCRK
jgi:outer membrane protein OmpA-like peptidoglycan-associated protein